LAGRGRGRRTQIPPTGTRVKQTGDNVAEMDDRHYAVVMNDEEMYSIWPASRPLPSGWRDMEVRGTKEECLDHIERVWTDMRPRSLRMYLEQASQAVKSS